MVAPTTSTNGGVPLASSTPVLQAMTEEMRCSVRGRVS